MAEEEKDKRRIAENEKQRAMQAKVEDRDLHGVADPPIEPIPPVSPTSKTRIGIALTPPSKRVTIPTIAHQGLNPLYPPGRQIPNPGYTQQQIPDDPLSLSPDTVLDELDSRAGLPAPTLPVAQRAAEPSSEVKADTGKAGSASDGPTQSRHVDKPSKSMKLLAERERVTAEARENVQLLERQGVDCRDFTYTRTSGDEQCLFPIINMVRAQKSKTTNALEMTLAEALGKQKEDKPPTSTSPTATSTTDKPSDDQKIMSETALGKQEENKSPTSTPSTATSTSDKPSNDQKAISEKALGKQKENKPLVPQSSSAASRVFKKGSVAQQARRPGMHLSANTRNPDYVRSKLQKATGSIGMPGDASSSHASAAQRPRSYNPPMQRRRTETNRRPGGVYSSLARSALSSVKSGDASTSKTSAGLPQSPSRPTGSGSSGLPRQQDIPRKGKGNEAKLSQEPGNDPRPSSDDTTHSPRGRTSSRIDSDRLDFIAQQAALSNQESTSPSRDMQTPRQTPRQASQSDRNLPDVDTSLDVEDVPQVTTEHIENTHVEHVEDAAIEHVEDVAEEAPAEHVEDAAAENVQDASAEHVEDAAARHTQAASAEHIEEATAGNVQDTSSEHIEDAAAQHAQATSAEHIEDVATEHIEDVASDSSSASTTLEDVLRALDAAEADISADDFGDSGGDEAAYISAMADWREISRQHEMFGNTHRLLIPDLPDSPSPEPIEEAPKGPGNGKEGMRNIRRNKKLKAEASQTGGFAPSASPLRPTPPPDRHNASGQEPSRSSGGLSLQELMLDFGDLDPDPVPSDQTVPSVPSPPQQRARSVSSSTASPPQVLFYGLDHTIFFEQRFDRLHDARRGDGQPDTRLRDFWSHHIETRPESDFSSQPYLSIRGGSASPPDAPPRRRKSSRFFEHEDEEVNQASRDNTLPGTHTPPSAHESDDGDPLPALYRRPTILTGDVVGRTINAGDLSPSAQLTPAPFRHVTILPGNVVAGNANPWDVIPPAHQGTLEGAAGRTLATLGVIPDPPKDSPSSTTASFATAEALFETPKSRRTSSNVSPKHVSRRTSSSVSPKHVHRRTSSNVSPKHVSQKDEDIQQGALHEPQRSSPTGTASGQARRGALCEPQGNPPAGAASGQAMQADTQDGSQQMLRAQKTPDSDLLSSIPGRKGPRSNTPTASSINEKVPTILKKEGKAPNYRGPKKLNISSTESTVINLPQKGHYEDFVETYRGKGRAPIDPGLWELGRLYGRNFSDEWYGREKTGRDSPPRSVTPPKQASPPRQMSPAKRKRSFKDHFTRKKRDLRARSPVKLPAPRRPVVNVNDPEPANKRAILCRWYEMQAQHEDEVPKRSSFMRIPNLEAHLQDQDLIAKLREADKNRYQRFRYDDNGFLLEDDNKRYMYVVRKLLLKRNEGPGERRMLDDIRLRQREYAPAEIAGQNEQRHDVHGELIVGPPKRGPASDIKPDAGEAITALDGANDKRVNEAGPRVPVQEAQDISNAKGEARDKSKSRDKDGSRDKGKEQADRVQGQADRVQEMQESIVQSTENRSQTRRRHAISGLSEPVLDRLHQQTPGASEYTEAVWLGKDVPPYEGMGKGRAHVAQGTDQPPIDTPIRARKRNAARLDEECGESLMPDVPPRQALPSTPREGEWTLDGPGWTSSSRGDPDGASSRQEDQRIGTYDTSRRDTVGEAGDMENIQAKDQPGQGSPEKDQVWWADSHGRRGGESDFEFPERSLACCRRDSELGLTESSNE